MAVYWSVPDMVDLYRQALSIGPECLSRCRFDKQTGIEPDKHTNILSWVRGDGTSHATIMRLNKTLAATPNIYHSFRNVISTPETWHTKATDLNSLQHRRILRPYHAVPMPLT
jgi:hypothetical protein